MTKEREMIELQKEIDAKAVAPRITPADIEANIVSEHYFTARDGRRGALRGQPSRRRPLLL